MDFKLIFGYLIHNDDHKSLINIYIYKYIQISVQLCINNNYFIYFHLLVILYECKPIAKLIRAL